MGLKNKKGRYYKVSCIESINVIHGTACVRYLYYEDQETRDNDLNDFLKSETKEISLTPEQIEEYTISAYELLKNSKVKTGEDKDGKDIFDYPYSEMVDC